MFVLKAGPEEFRTGWFVESVMTEVLIIVVMRTWQPFYKSRLSRPLLISMILVLIITVVLPYSPISELLGFKPMALSSLMLLGLITLLYVAASEVVKRIFYRKMIKQEPAGANRLPERPSAMQSANTSQAHSIS
jgi:Mg2+-importing ATPase